MKRDTPTTLAAAPNLPHALVHFCGYPGVCLQYTMGDLEPVIQPHLLGSCLGQSHMWSFAVPCDLWVAAILQASWAEVSLAHFGSPRDFGEAGVHVSSGAWRFVPPLPTDGKPVQCELNAVGRGLG